MFLTRKQIKKQLGFFLKRKKGINNISFLGKRYNMLIYLKMIYVNIFGLGIKNYIRRIFCLYGINLNLSSYFFNLDFLYYSQVILRDCLINYDLIKYITYQITYKKKILIYSGRRHFLNLPTRGQRSKTNAQTQKKKT